MKTAIQGKEIETTYVVKVLRDDNGKIKSKPKMEQKSKIIKWSNLFEPIDGEIKFNACSYFTLRSNIFYPKINISETEEVSIIEQVYRADINTLILHTDKIISEKSINKDKAEKDLKTALIEYNHYVVENNDKMKAYCSVNKIDIDTVNIDDLKKIVGENNDYITIKSDLNFINNFTITHQQYNENRI